MTSEDKADSLVREEENLRMRNWVVNSILQSETSYIEDLNVLVRVSPTYLAIIGHCPAANLLHHQLHARCTVRTYTLENALSRCFVCCQTLITNYVMVSPPSRA